MKDHYERLMCNSFKIVAVRDTMSGCVCMETELLYCC